MLTGAAALSSDELYGFLLSQQTIGLCDGERRDALEDSFTRRVQSNPDDDRARHASFLFHATLTELKRDAQGRITIPAVLLRAAGIEDRELIPARYPRYVALVSYSYYVTHIQPMLQQEETMREYQSIVHQVLG